MIENKETVIVLRPGKTRAVNLPAHELATIGFATFAVAGMDNNRPIQWSVIGARKSELESGEGYNFPHKCRVHVLNDQYSVEDRIINVSVVGYDNITKAMAEATAKLTVKVKASAPVEDFTFRVEAPQTITTDGSDTVPTKVEIKAIINEVVPTGNENPYHMVCYIDTDDKTSSRVQMVQSTEEGKGNEFSADVTEVCKATFGQVSQVGYSTLNFTVDAMKMWKNDEEHYYKQAQGGKIIIRKTGA